MQRIHRCDSAGAHVSASIYEALSGKYQNPFEAEDY